MKNLGLVSLAKFYSFKFERKYNGRFVCLGMNNTPLQKLTFDSVYNAARAYLIFLKLDNKPIQEAYLNGLRIGRNWQERYIPGGPCVFPLSRYDDWKYNAKSMVLSIISQAEHKAWHMGFKEGRKNAPPMKPKAGFIK